MKSKLQWNQHDHPSFKTVKYFTHPGKKSKLELILAGDGFPYHALRIRIDGWIVNRRFPSECSPFIEAEKIWEEFLSDLVS